MESAKYAAALGKIIKYSKNCRENEKHLAIFTVILMATFGTKNVHYPGDEDTTDGLVILAVL